MDLGGTTSAVSGVAIDFNPERGVYVLCANFDKIATAAA